MHVQRKWMYLESIFVGSDDIRHQLPAEAKRFDNIDRQWQKIMNDTAKVCKGRRLAGPYPPGCGWLANWFPPHSSNPLSLL